MCRVLVPLSSHDSLITFEMNPLPLSLRIFSGVPRIADNSSSTLITSGDFSLRKTSSAIFSRVYLSKGSYCHRSASSERNGDKGQIWYRIINPGRYLNQTTCQSSNYLGRFVSCLPKTSSPSVTGYTPRCSASECLRNAVLICFDGLD